MITIESSGESLIKPRNCTEEKLKTKSKTFEKETIDVCNKSKIRKSSRICYDENNCIHPKGSLRGKQDNIKLLQKVILFYKF